MDAQSRLRLVPRTRAGRRAGWSAATHTQRHGCDQRERSCFRTSLRREAEFCLTSGLRMRTRQSREAFQVVFAMVVLLAIPAAVTLKHIARFGYTWSLSLFIIPI